MATVFTKLSNDDSATLNVFLFTVVDGLIYTELKTWLENVLNHVTEKENFSENKYYIQMNAEFTRIFDLYADEYDDLDDDDLDDDVRGLVLEINSYQLLQAMMDYRQKRGDLSKGWQSAIVIEGNPKEITVDKVRSKV